MKIQSNLYGNIKPICGNKLTIYSEYKWTSAGVKSSFAYNELITTFENSIINPDESFCVGMDYRIPVMHGLTDKKYINSLKMSPSFNEASFATEYETYVLFINIENCWDTLRVIITTT